MEQSALTTDSPISRFKYLIRSLNRRLGVSLSPFDLSFVIFTVSVGTNNSTYELVNRTGRINNFPKQITFEFNRVPEEALMIGGARYRAPVSAETRKAASQLPRATQSYPELIELQR